MRDTAEDCPDCEVKPVEYEQAERMSDDPFEADAMMRTGVSIDACGEHDEEFTQMVDEVV